jgi:hypothetical protein
MPPGITPLKNIFTLLKRLRWFLTLAILFIAVGLCWYGWHSGGGIVWIAFISALLLLLLAAVWSGKITFWLARRLGNQILRSRDLASRRLANANLQQGKKLAYLGGKELGKNIAGVKQALGQARNSLGQDLRVKPGNVTWISAPPDPHSPDVVCPTCGRGLRSGAKFCDRCGKPIMRS